MLGVSSGNMGYRYGILLGLLWDYAACILFYGWSHRSHLLLPLGFFGAYVTLSYECFIYFGMFPLSHQDANNDYFLLSYCLRRCSLGQFAHRLITGNNFQNDDLVMLVGFSFSQSNIITISPMRVGFSNFFQ